MFVIFNTVPVCLMKGAISLMYQNTGGYCRVCVCNMQLFPSVKVRCGTLQLEHFHFSQSLKVPLSHV